MLRFNENNEVIRDETYRAIIVGLQWRGDITRSMDELEGLCEADGIEVVGRVVQSLDRPNTATYIGSGKVLEIAELCGAMEVDTVIVNNELSGIQIRNLEDAFGVRVIDRTILILDIFADRATSREGKLQVELAQLQYRMPRLTGFGKSLSRLGGGIGTRGPGEKKLETDRRHIERRIDDIKLELAKSRKNRQTQRAERDKTGIPVVALMGYTNSGKSAIMNKLIEMTAPKNQAEGEAKVVKSQDMLFATLDTQHRKIVLAPGREFILIDTVGFVSGLPHSLVEAFKSTLEEVNYADLLIHVADCSYEGMDFQVNVATDVIRQIGAAGKPVVMAYNKMDLVDEPPIETLGQDSVFISAKTGMNMDDLIDAINTKLFGSMVNAQLLIPYNKGNIVSYLCENAQVDSMTYEAEGTLISGKFKVEDYNRYVDFEVKR